MQALGGSFHRSAVYNFLSCYWKRLTDVLLSPSHSGLPRCLRQNEKKTWSCHSCCLKKNALISHWFLGWYVYTYIYIFMYIHQTWHGIDMSFPPVPFGKPEPLNLPGSSPYDPEIWSTLDGIKGFRRSSEKVEKLRGKHGNGHGNPPGFPICVFPKIGGFPPNHPLKNRVFHYFHHPFWGTVRIFGNTPFAWTSKNGGDFFPDCKNWRYRSLYLTHLQDNPEV